MSQLFEQIRKLISAGHNKRLLRRDDDQRILIGLADVETPHPAVLHPITPHLRSVQVSASHPLTTTSVSFGETMTSGF